MTLEAKGEFPFTFYIEKAVAADIEEELILEGVASTTNIDHDDERMSREALQAMANIINEQSVPLRVEHSKSDNAVIGKVFKGWLDDRNQLHIRASLDKSHPVSPILHRSMKSDGKKMGFSVGGIVKHAVKEFSESVGRLVKTFYDVELKEVSVTPRPANYDSWAISKSIARDEEDAERSRGSGLYDQFLFAHPQMDYMQAFAKSIPDEAWRKVESSDITKSSQHTFMTKETEKKADMEDSTGAETEKAISRQEFNVLTKGIEALANAFTAFAEKTMDSKAKDTTNPDKMKPTVIGGEATKKALSDDANDQDSPDKKKPKQVGDGASKSREGQEDEGGNGSDEHGTREKAAKEDKTDEYKLETVERSIASLENLTKRITGVKKMTDEKDETTKKAEDDETTKKTDDEKDETTTKYGKDETTEKGVHPLDQFVIQVTKTIEAMVDKMEKSNVNVLGFRKSIVDSIVNDPSMQEEIQKMMKLPGQKRSMSLGVPYMVTKEGKRFALAASEVSQTTIAKSQDGEKKPSFKDFYKKEFSSVRGEQE